MALQKNIDYLESALEETRASIEKQEAQLADFHAYAIRLEGALSILYQLKDHNYELTISSPLRPSKASSLPASPQRKPVHPTERPHSSNS
jgi:hypothetical protein